MAFFKYFPVTEYNVQNDINVNIVDIFRQVRAVSYLLDDVNAYEFYDITDGERPDVASFKLYETVDYYWTFFLLNDNLRNGLVDWPKSYTELEDYVNLKYPGYVIQGTREINAIKDNTNVMIAQFSEQEVITGSVSGATATISEIDANNNLIVLTNLSGTFTAGETINGSNGGLLIDNDDYNWDIGLYADAPKHYVDENNNIVDFVDLIESESITALTNKQYEINLNDENSRIRVIRKNYVEDFSNTYRELINR